MSPPTHSSRRGRLTEPPRPRRKRVVLADQRRPPQVARTMMELEEQNSVGEVLVRNLVRAQARTAWTLAAVLALALFGVPVLLWAVPGLASTGVWGVSSAWLLLGVLVYPLLVLLGYRCVRRAERHEHEFLRLVEE